MTREIHLMPASVFDIGAECSHRKMSGPSEHALGVSLACSAVEMVVEENRFDKADSMPSRHAWRLLRSSIRSIRMRQSEQLHYERRRHAIH